MMGTSALVHRMLAALAMAAASACVFTHLAHAGPVLPGAPRAQPQSDLCPALRASLEMTRTHLAAAATKGLSAAERGRVQSVIGLLRGGKQDAAMGEWDALMQSVVTHRGLAVVDVALLTGYVLRESYLEASSDLSYLADRVSAENEAKRALRQCLSELRNIQAQQGNGQGGAMGFRPVTIEVPVPAPVTPRAAWQGSRTGPAVSFQTRTLTSPAEVQACAYEVEKALAEMQMSFNLQYLMLQNKISHENRQFTMISNIMKTKHDTAKNSINNIR